MIAEVILGVHFVIIVFNVLALVVIPVGAWAGWRFVRWAWLRVLHLGVMGVVAGQAVAGRACFLTIWEDELTGNRTVAEPMIMRWVDGVIYWDVPIWGFAVFYSVLFLYVVGLLVWVPFWGRDVLE